MMTVSYAVVPLTQNLTIHRTTVNPLSNVTPSEAFVLILLEIVMECTSSYIALHLHPGRLVSVLCL